MLVISVPRIYSCPSHPDINAVGHQHRGTAHDSCLGTIDIGRRPCGVCTRTRVCCIRCTASSMICPARARVPALEFTFSHQRVYALGSAKGRLGPTPSNILDYACYEVIKRVKNSWNPVSSPYILRVSILGSNFALRIGSSETIEASQECSP